MKSTMFRNICLICLVGISVLSTSSLTTSAGNQIRIYNHAMNPRQHPDDLRRYVKPPDTNVFGNQIQFMALRDLAGDFKKSLDTYTIKYDLGNIIWPSYPLIYQENLPEVLAELKKRDLYLFDLWGYVPGSGPGGYWQQFVVPEKSLKLFSKELGNHWLGMDNGEQDGRYVGGFASQMMPQGDTRAEQYLNFQNHFQGLTDRLGNNMSALVSLNFGHYFLKEGVYALIGAETAQGLPNAQVYYSFIRGAGKQYGVPWFGNASVWNRWGWKNYSGITSDKGGDTEGTSLSLLKRLIYSHIMYNCVAVGFEGSHLDKKGELSPIGKIQQSANKWVKKYGSPGNLYTPVAIMGDFFSGWSFPRHLYSGNIYRVWGNLPYEEGDYLKDGLLSMFYPGYQDASYFHDETGFITPTPFGDAADCILSDSPLWILQQYPVLVIGDRLNGGTELKEKLEKYVETGGHLIITAGSLINWPDGLSGIHIGKNRETLQGNTLISYNGSQLEEKTSFEILDLGVQAGSKEIATCNGRPIVVEQVRGSGKITLFATPFGLSSGPGVLPKSSEDQALKTPFPLLNHVRQILGDIFNGTKIFESGDKLSMITCRKGEGDFTVAVCNNSWLEKPLKITSNAGRIIRIAELPVDCSEQKATGFLPKSEINNTGKNSKTTIAGGDIRIFTIQLEENNIKEIPYIKPQPNPVNRGLALRNISSVKKEILLRPTFFQHFDRVLIDWKYLLEKEQSVLANESGWMSRQGLKLIVDLSSGINLFPDLRLVNNDPLEFNRSLEMIKSVLDKMAVLGVEDLILSSHRLVENNFTEKEFDESMHQTIKVLCHYAAKHNINVNFKMAPGRKPGNLQQVEAFVKSVNEPNLFVAPVTASILGNSETIGQNVDLLKSLKFRILLVAAPERDIFGTLWNTNKPITDFEPKAEIKQVLSTNPESTLILDGLYNSQDEEYKDIRSIENLVKN